MKKRSKEYYRKVRVKAINRKKKIIKDYIPDGIPKQFDSKNLVDILHADVPGFNEFSIWNYDCDGKLAKEKIHCSCPLCSFKGKTFSDKKRLEKARFDLADYMDETEYNQNIRNEIAKIDKNFKKPDYPSRAISYEENRANFKKPQGEAESFYEFKLIDLIRECEGFACEFGFTPPYFDLALAKIIEDFVGRYIERNHIPSSALTTWIKKISENDSYFKKFEGKDAVRKALIKSLVRLCSGA